jgi:hypothetical protein
MKAVILLALFCALALSNVSATFNKRQHDIHKDISRVQARPLSDQERKAAYEAALPKNRKSKGKKQFGVDPDDVDHGPRSTKHKEGRAVVRNEWELEPSFWYNKAKNELDEAVRRQVRNKKVAKNVIVFIGDGMNMPTVTSGRILKGHLNGKLGAEEDLNFDLFPHSGLSKTYSVDHQTPDSAATATAIHTGVKTKSAVLGMTAAVTPGQCEGSAGNEIKSVLEESQENGKAESGVWWSTLYVLDKPLWGKRSKFKSSSAPSLPFKCPLRILPLVTVGIFIPSPINTMTFLATFLFLTCLRTASSSSFFALLYQNDGSSSHSFLTTARPSLCFVERGP